MWIVVDRKQWCFLKYKHASKHAVANLLWLSVPLTHPILMTKVDDHAFLAGLSDIQMMALYKNTTGQTATKLGDPLRNLLQELAERIPSVELNLFELEKQAEQVQEFEVGNFEFDPGQFKPKKLSAVPARKPITLPRAPNENEIAARPRARPVAAPPPPSATGVAPPSSARPQRAPSGPRQGGVRELIWAVADKLWEAKGKPTDVKEVLALRKEWMVVLESEHNVKRTSSSNELGNWMKARIQK